ncbi:hypothetical protein D0501_05805 [Leuconostoc holzapfelii]|uniref:Gp58-like domain-containing protein n=1 Tax=Leuconostoc holzapfelii TaxID=434464 RepID=A0ABT2P033_9LACO|nr:hypothetical protein [Leuconostoc holzapfelii]MCT8389587.1 hypothetical protein [Leuconostoc holzapfelii]
MTYNKNTWEPHDLITSDKLNNIEDGVSNVLERITYGTGGAQQNTEPIHTPVYINAGEPFPPTPIAGDYVFVKDGDDFTIYEYVGVTWVKQIDPNLKARLTDVLTQANTDAKSLVDQSASDVNAVLDDVKAKQAQLETEQAELDTKAQGYANQALSDAKADTQATAVQTAKDAADALAAAKTDLDSAISQEATDRANAVTDLDTKAQGYATQAKTDAISAATTADGVINKKIDDTASSITTTISQNKADADGKITTAQSTAQQALDGLSTKVSQTDYDTKTGQLQTDLTAVTTTANGNKTDIVAIKTTNDSQDARMTTIESDANGVKTTVSDLQATQGQQAGSISTLEQRADGFDATVTKVNNLQVGGRNLLLNSKDFSKTPDWTSGTEWYIGGNLSTDTYQGLSVIQTNGAWGGPKYRTTDLFSRGVVNTTDTYVLSAWMRNTGTAPVHVSYYAETATNSNTQVVVLPAGSDWVRVTSPAFKFTNANDSTIRFEPTEGVTGGYLEQAGLKLEKGNLSTDWSPAPEDVEGATAKAQLTADQATVSINNYKTSNDGRVSQAEANITANANAITTKVSQSDYNAKTGDLATKVNTAQSTADGANTTIGAYQATNDARVSSAEANITANANAITQKVSQTDYNTKTGQLDAQISTINQTATGISQSVSNVQAQVNNLQVGGRNLYLNSRAIADSYGLYGGTVTVEPFDSTTNMWHFIMPQGQGMAGIYLWNYGNGKIPDNSDWTYSADVKGTGTLLAFGIELGSHNPIVGTVGSNWSRISQTGRVDSGTMKTPIMYFDSTNGLVDVYIKLPKLEIGNLPTGWSPAPEDTATQISTVSQKVDSITSIVSEPATGLSTRVQTAEGNISTVQSNVSDLQSKQTQTANGLTTEISDRQNGDSNTLTQAKDFTTSSIGNSESGMRSQITQTSNAILANLGSANLFPNSEFEKDYGYRDKNGSVSTLSLAQKNDIDGRLNGTVTVVSDAAAWQGYWARNIPVYGGQSYSMSTLVHYTNGGLSNGKALLDVWFVDKDGNRISSGTVSTGQVSSPYWVKLYVENVIAPTNAVNVQVSLIVNDAGAGQTATFTQPMVTATERLQPYAVNNDITTQLALLKDNWSVGINGNTGALASGIAGDANAMAIVSPKVTINSPQTQITGKLSANQIDVAELSAVSAKLGDVTSGSITNPINIAKTGNSNAVIVGNTLIDSDGVTMNADILVGGSKVYTENVTINPDTGLGFKWLDSSGNIVRNATVNELGVTVGTGSGLTKTTITEAGTKLQSGDGNVTNVDVNGVTASTWRTYTQTFSQTNMDMPIQFTRQGHVVTASVNFITYGPTPSSDQAAMSGGKLAVGWRPQSRVELLINANASGNNPMLVTISIFPDGTVQKTAPNIDHQTRMMGSTTYQTFMTLPDSSHANIVSDAQGYLVP